MWDLIISHVPLIMDGAVLSYFPWLFTDIIHKWSRFNISMHVKQFTLSSLNGRLCVETVFLLFLSSASEAATVNKFTYEVLGHNSLRCRWFSVSCQGRTWESLSDHPTWSTCKKKWTWDRTGEQCKQNLYTTNLQHTDLYLFIYMWPQWPLDCQVSSVSSHKPSSLFIYTVYVSLKPVGSFQSLLHTDMFYMLPVGLLLDGVHIYTSHQVHLLTMQWTVQWFVLSPHSKKVIQFYSLGLFWVLSISLIVLNRYFSFLKSPKTLI